MEETIVKDIFSVLKKTDVKVNYDESELNDSIELFKFKNPNEFQAFLIHSRIKKFIILNLLLHFGLDNKMLIGSENNTDSIMVGFDDDGEEKYNVKHLGCGLVDKEFEGLDVFETILYNLGFSQINTDRAVLLHLENWKTKIKPRENSDDVENPQQSFKHKIYLFKDLPIMIFSDKLYFNKKLSNEIYNLVSFHNDKFREFLNEYKDKCVSHDIYVDWLTTWFRGHVKVRSLEAK